MSKKAVIHAYRHLYRQGLRAVQFSKPSRYTVRDRLRHAFRKGRRNQFDPQKIANTLEFLKLATTTSGLEHKILKNLCFVWWHQSSGRFRNEQKHSEAPKIEAKVTVFDAFNHNIRMLNESMDMCIPADTIKLPPL